MAVLRAHKLWMFNIAAAPAQDLPADPMNAPPDPQSAAGVYSCPAGKRAIVRCITHVPSSSLPPGAQASLVMSVISVANQTLPFHRFWWQLDTGTGYRFLAEDLWRGMLVLDAGEQVFINNYGTHSIVTHGSGMEMPLPAYE